MEKGERILNQNLVKRLFDAACDEDWDLIDNNLILELSKVDGNKMAEELLVFAQDDNPNIRDIVATSLTVLKITDKQIRREAIDKMIVMATEDEEIFPAGRAAVFLLKNRRYVNLVGPIINDAVGIFKERAQKNDWVEGLEDNIPQLKKLFK